MVILINIANTDRRIALLFLLFPRPHVSFSLITTVGVLSLPLQAPHQCYRTSHVNQPRYLPPPPSPLPYILQPPRRLRFNPSISTLNLLTSSILIRRLCLRGFQLPIDDTYQTLCAFAPTKDPIHLRSGFKHLLI